MSEKLAKPCWLLALDPLGLIKSLSADDAAAGHSDDFWLRFFFGLAKDESEFTAHISH